ncbi:hypothetical protein ABR776_24990, partial [Bacillus cereus]
VPTAGLSFFRALSPTSRWNGVKGNFLLRFLQKISPNQSGSYGWFVLLQSFIPYQPLERGKGKLSFAVFEKDQPKPIGFL